MLGGGFEGAINLARGGYEINSGGDRFVEAAVLARRYPDAKVVVSGGTGTLVLDGEGDADTAPKLFEALGIPASRLILENEVAQHLRECRELRKLVTPGPDETWLLVTSAFHMPRSMGLFRKAAFPVLPWPVDYRTSGKEGIGVMRDNPADSLQTTTMAVREWIGLIAYKFVRADRFASSLAPTMIRRQAVLDARTALRARGEELPPDEHAEQQQRGQREDQPGPRTSRDSRSRRRCRAGRR